MFPLILTLEVGIVTTTSEVAVNPFEVVAVMVAVPFPTEVTVPLLETVETDVSLLVHVMVLSLEVRFGVKTTFNVSFNPLPFNSILFLFNSILLIGSTTVITEVVVSL